MSKKTAVLFLCIVSLSLPVWSASKTKTIGDYTFLTEQNSFERIIEQATRQNKKVMVVFSAKWCLPCQIVKKNVFETAEFKAVADKVLLVYIEETTSRGKDYVQRFKIQVFPTFKLFDSDGTELDTYRNYEEITVDSFTDWIAGVEKGISLHAARLKVEQDPINREYWIELSLMLDEYNIEEKLQVFRRIIELGPGPEDELTQQFQEKRALLIVNIIQRYRDGSKADERARLEREFLEPYELYYPDRLAYDLKGSTGFLTYMVWQVLHDKNAEALSIFSDFLQTNHTMKDSIAVYLAAALISFSSGDAGWQDITGQPVGSADIIALIDQTTRLNPRLWDSPEFCVTSLSLYPVLIDVCVKQGQRDKAATYAQTMYQKMTALNSDERGELLEAYFDQMIVQVASENGFLTKQALDRLDNQLNEAERLEYAYLATQKIAVVYQDAGPDVALEYGLGVVASESTFKGLSTSEKSELLNNLAWTYYELSLVSDPVLELARKSVKLQENANNLDTLASILAARGEYKQAMKYETRALKKLDRDRFRREFEDKIALWQKGQNSTGTEDESLVSDYLLRSVSY
ncbi:thioredoxin family protein [bacterium]|nr:thioredoxin family protein [bacterium]